MENTIKSIPDISTKAWEERYDTLWAWKTAFEKELRKKFREADENWAKWAIQNPIELKEILWQKSMLARFTAQKQIILEILGEK